MASILIFEDDVEVARLLALTFRLEGHETGIVGDGDAARARLDGPPADLLVLDVMLAGSDGLSLLRALREAPGWEDCRVVVLSALDGDEDVWRGWVSGADYYLTKPFDLGHLCEIVERLLGDEPLDAASLVG